jgi:hypothetical protein
MATRKDYERAAKIVRTTNFSGGSAWLQRQAIENAFIYLFDINVNFDKERFIKACRNKNA